MKIKNINISLYHEDFRDLINGQNITINHHCSEIPIKISLNIEFHDIIRIIKQKIEINKKNKDPSF